MVFRPCTGDKTTNKNRLLDLSQTKNKGALFLSYLGLPPPLPPFPFILNPAAKNGRGEFGRNTPNEGSSTAISTAQRIREKGGMF